MAPNKDVKVSDGASRISVEDLYYTLSIRQNEVV